MRRHRHRGRVKVATRGCTDDIGLSIAFIFLLFILFELGAEGVSTVPRAFPAQTDFDRLQRIAVMPQRQLAETSTQYQILKRSTHFRVIHLVFNQPVSLLIHKRLRDAADRMLIVFRPDRFVHESRRHDVEIVDVQFISLLNSLRFAFECLSTKHPSSNTTSTTNRHIINEAV